MNVYIPSAIGTRMAELLGVVEGPDVVVGPKIISKKWLLSMLCGSEPFFGSGLRLCDFQVSLSATTEF